MNLNELIINKPQNQSKRQKITSILVTTVAWSVWSYMWLPLLGLIGWYLGFEFFQNAMKDNGWTDFLKEIPSYVNYVSIASGSLLAWALINWYRFGGSKDKRARGEHKILKTSEQATFIGVRNSTLRQWQKSKRVVAHYYQSGKLSHMLTNANEPYQGIPASADPSAEEALAKSLHEALEKLDSSDHKKYIDIRVDLTKEQELVLIEKKIQKIQKLIVKYEKDLSVLAKLDNPSQIVPLFSAQKRRLEQLNKALEDYQVRKEYLKCEFDLRLEDKKTSTSQEAGVIKNYGSAILDGRKYLEEQSAKELVEALD